MTLGRMSANAKEVDRDETKLGCFCWTKLGGAGKMTYIMTVYMPHNRKYDKIKGLTVWDQHKTHYEREGSPDKEPCQALIEDMTRKLLEWKREDCKIVVASDFNQDVYQDFLSKRLAEDDLNLTEHVLRTTVL